MRTVSIQIPGKTFLAGEYVALKGGPAILLSTAPFFTVYVSEQPHGASKCVSSSFHQQSPAGRLIEEHPQCFNGLSLRMENPYKVGGFGASTAEFIAAHAVLQSGRSLWGDQQQEWDLSRMLSDYQRLAKNTESRWTPSGADLVAQVLGGISYFEFNLGRVEKLEWNLSDIGFSLISTGKKVPTHEHLNTLGSFSSEKMTSEVNGIYAALSQRNSQKFIFGISNFQEDLRKQGLIADSTAEIMKSIQHLSILVAKGCGALGADVICVIYKIEKEEEVVGGLTNLGFAPLATQRSLATKGLTVVGLQGIHPPQSERNEVAL